MRDGELAVSAAWVSGSVRARLLVAERRLGAEGARELAASPSLRDALVALGRSPYRREVSLELELEAAQRALAVKTLLDLRLLAGWLPRDALGLLRALAAWFELANLEDRIAYLDGAPLREPFELGSLAGAWPRAAEAQSIEELRQALAPTAWGDPGGETAAELGLGLRLAWARRVTDAAPAAAGLGRGRGRAARRARPVRRGAPGRGAAAAADPPAGRDVAGRPDIRPLRGGATARRRVGARRHSDARAALARRGALVGPR